MQFDAFLKKKAREINNIKEPGRRRKINKVDDHRKTLHNKNTPEKMCPCRNLKSRDAFMNAVMEGLQQGYNSTSNV